MQICFVEGTLLCSFLLCIFVINGKFNQRVKQKKSVLMHKDIILLHCNPFLALSVLAATAIVLFCG